KERTSCCSTGIVSVSSIEIATALVLLFIASKEILPASEHGQQAAQRFRSQMRCCSVARDSVSSRAQASMRFYVAITDFDWFSQLSAQKPDEVNFWQPSGNNQFRALSPGEPLLFKLHSPRNFIVGGGFFSHFSLSPLSLAWDAFGLKNGAITLDQMQDRVRRYRHHDATGGEEIIGCILLQQPFFFAEPEWIQVSDWPRPTVRGKSYETQESRGAEIWAEVKARLTQPAPALDESVEVQIAKYGKPQILLPRLGQGAFRMLIADT